MQALPASFNALGRYRQFVIWQAIPNKKNPKKTDKITIHPQTLKKHDAHDPSIWMDYQSAINLAAIYGPTYGVGFELTENDPFWFLDIDNCVDQDDQWTKNANQLREYFDGCAIEISHSGTGIHIIGSKDYNIGEHSKKNKQFGFEFYTELRFIALTGNSVYGDAGYIAPYEILNPFKDFYFPEKSHEISASWTSEPCKESDPIKTDKALIKKMLESKSASSVFGHKASAADLWNRNIEKLAVAYPALNAVDPYDLSSAELGLCNHLAFWTGKDCERIERLFTQSQLVRDKWTDRKKYRQDTILKACSQVGQCYGAAKAAAEAAKRTWHPQDKISNDVVIKVNHGAEIVPYEMREEFFKGHYYLTRWSKVFCPDGVLRSQTEYNAMYGNFEFAAPFGGKPINEPWKAYVTCADITRAEVYDTAYRPEYDFGVVFKEPDHRHYVNEYIALDGKRIAGNAAPFINHLKTILPNGDDALILASWIAALIQYPGKKFFWAPFIQGIEGNGKSLIVKIIEYCIGDEHVEDVDPEDFCNSGGKFNSYIKNHRLAVLEEIKQGNRNQAENALKRFIGRERIQMQKKGVDQVTIPTCINWILNSNHKDAINIKDGSRRFAILFCAQQEPEDMIENDMQRGGSYFNKLFNWLDNDNGYAICADYLDNFEIPEQYNPATLADKAPMTTSFLEAVEESKSSPHQMLVEMLSSDKPGTRGSWVSIQAVNQIYRDEYGQRPPSGKMLAKYLKEEGYIKHPSLTNQGRATKVIVQEGGRSVIYVKKNSPHLEIKDGAQVTKLYLKAQGYEGIPTLQQIEVND